MKLTLINNLRGAGSTVGEEQAWMIRCDGRPYLAPLMELYAGNGTTSDAKALITNSKSDEITLEIIRKNRYENQGEESNCAGFRIQRCVNRENKNTGLTPCETSWEEVKVSYLKSRRMAV